MIHRRFIGAIISITVFVLLLTLWLIKSVGYGVLSWTKHRTPYADVADVCRIGARQPGATAPTGTWI